MKRKLKLLINYKADRIRLEALLDARRTRCVTCNELYGSKNTRTWQEWRETQVSGKCGQCYDNITDQEHAAAMGYITIEKPDVTLEVLGNLNEAKKAMGLPYTDKMGRYVSQNELDERDRMGE
jgi:hypothetical protein